MAFLLREALHVVLHLTAAAAVRCGRACRGWGALQTGDTARRPRNCSQVLGLCRGLDMGVQAKQQVLKHTQQLHGGR